MKQDTWRTYEAVGEAGVGGSGSELDKSNRMNPGASRGAVVPFMHPSPCCDVIFLYAPLLLPLL